MKRAAFYYYLWLFFAAGMTAAFPFMLKGQNETRRVLPQDRQVQKIERKLYRVTGFCACNICCPGSDDGITASGYRIKSGDKLVAAPASIPFGTIVTIPGYGTATVRDRGILIDDTVDHKHIKVDGKVVARKTADFDVYFSRHADALAWGVKNITVTSQEK
jgi:3D (Asp-Asp-Asp) domain-containing protein